VKKPMLGKPRSASAMFSLSRKLPKLKQPLSAAASSLPRPKPVIGKPGAPVERKTPPPASINVARCQRCGHAEPQHPLRFVCDKYPHPDPLQLCGCEVEQVGDVCARCGHKARSHKARHRCKAADCRCWGFDGEGEAASAPPC